MGKKMVDVMREEASKCDLKDLVLKLIPEYMGGEIEKACAGIFPMQNVFVRKVKVLKKPKFDLVRLMELHSGEGAEDSGDKAEGDAEEVGRRHIFAFFTVKDINTDEGNFSVTVLASFGGGHIDNFAWMTFHHAVAILSES